MVDLTPELRIAINVALENAQHRRHEFAGTEHLFLGLLHDKVSAKAIKACGGNVNKLLAQTESFLEEFVPAVPEGRRITTAPSLGFQEAIQFAALNAESSEREIVAGPHVLIAMYNLKDCHAVYLLKQQGIEKLDLQQYVSQGRGGVDEDDDELAFEGGSDDDEDDDDEGEGKKTKDALASFTVNLNEEAAAGRIDPMVGRSAELTRCIHILARRRKNNPVLVGDAGVGKTAIVEGLALAIHDGDVPEPLRTAVIYALDVGALVAGTRYRGDFENRLKAVVKQLEKLGDEAVLFVDEIHTLIGAGAASGGALDASSILKPLLARGKIRCVGATTWKEYRQIFERDHALARRFQKIDVGEPSIEETEQILLGLKPKYEEFHGVEFTEAGLAEAARLAGRYLNDRRLPDKAIDVIDEAAAEVKLAGGGVVYVTNIEQTISRMAGIPSQTLEHDDRAALGRLEDDLKAAVFGQDEAIEQLTVAVKLARTGLSDPDKPIGSFLFTGPTGVGKTEVARQLAKTLALELIRFDMSEYMERHTVSRLIGAPPGYVGFDQGGQLTDAVAKTPHAVVLLDEIEKAHPDVYNLLLQVMDHGTLTDNTGKKTDFRNVILIMTSNVGARDLARKRPGFFADDADRAGDDSVAFKKLFSPEFRNRLDARIRFQPLDISLMVRIAQKFLKELEAQLAEKQVSIRATDAALEVLAKLGYDPENGARPMARVIRDKIKKGLADDLLFGDLARGGEVVIRARDGELVFDVTPATPTPASAAETEAKLDEIRAEAKATDAEPAPDAEPDAE